MDPLKVSGTNLTLNGSPWHATGFNLPYQMVRQSTEPLATALAAWPAGASVCRMFCFQTFNIVGGKIDFTLLDTLLAAFTAAGVRVILVLGNNVNGAGHANDDGALKALPWWQGGSPNGYDVFVQTTSGTPQVVPYRQFVSLATTHVKGNPAVAMIQLVNEAQAINADGTGSETAAYNAMNAFATDVGGLVKSIDPNRLVSLGNVLGFNGGPAGQQWTGSQTFVNPPTSPTVTNADYQLLAANAFIDVLDYHDYGQPLNPMPFPTGGNHVVGLGAALAIGATVSKPVMVGESGVDYTSGATINPVLVPATTARRAALRQAQLYARFEAGMALQCDWSYRINPQVSDGSDFGMEVGPSDPQLANMSPLPYLAASQQFFLSAGGLYQRSS